MKLLRPIIFLSLAIIAFACNNGNNQQTEDSGFLVEIGDTATDVEFKFTDGSVTSLKQLRGKVVVLQFTASWCSVCRKEMPHLEKEVWQRFKNDDFILIGVDYDEPLEKVLAFKKQMKTTYPMSLDPEARIFSKFAHKKSGVTRNVVIDKNGQIAFLTRLYERKKFEKMIEKIEDLLEY